MSEETSPRTFSLLKKIDDTVFAIEQTVVATFLSAMTVMVFLDVVSRRLTARDSKLGALLARLFRIEDAETRATLDQFVAPAVGALIGIAIIYFAYRTVKSKRAILLTLATAAGLAFLGWMMAAQREVEADGVVLVQQLVPSKYFYLLLYGLFAGAWGTKLSKTRPEGWQRRIVALVVGGIVLGGFAFLYFPDEYSWSLEVCGIMILWVGALGASICAYAGKHIRLQALAKTAPATIEPYARALGFFAAGCFTAALTYLSTRSLLKLAEFGLAFEQTGIPDWVASSALPVAFGLATLRFAAAAGSAVLGGHYGVTVDDDLAAAAAAAEADS